MISKLAPFVIGNSIYIDDTLENLEINFNFLLEMEDLTIVSGIKGNGLSLQHSSSDKDIFKSNLISLNKILMIENEDKNKTFSLKCYKVTKLGTDILKLGDFKSNEKYILNIGNKIKD